MPIKSTPELSAVFFPRSAIRKRETEGFVLSERLTDILRPGWGDYQDQLAEGSFAALNPTLDWGKHPQFDSLQNVGFARFSEDGIVEFGPSRPQGAGDKSISVAYILPRQAALDSKIGSTTLDGGNTDLNWVAKSGTWQTVPALEVTGGTAIYNTGSQATATAETVEKIPANRSLRFKLSFLGLSRSGERPQFQLTWGNNKYRLTFRHEAKISLERLVVVSGGVVGGVSTATTQWQTWKTLHQGPNCNLRGGNYTVIIMRLAGRLVVRVGPLSVWVLNAKVNGNNISTEEPYSVSDVGWEEGSLSVKTTNCRARIETGVVKWCSPTGLPFIGTMVRTVGRLGGGSETGAGFPGGWPRAGTKMQVVPVGGAGTLTWTATLTASKDGIDTPCLDRVLARATPQWGDSFPVGVPLGYAVSRAQVSLAMPPLLAGTEVTLDLDLSLLENTPNWQNVTQARCPVDVSIRWRYDNGAPGAWSRVLSGYVFKPAQEITGYANGAVQLVLRDPIMRLQKPAAVVDHRFAPLELLFLEQMASHDFSNNGFDPNTGYYDPSLDPNNPFRTPVAGALYGAQCVQELLRIQLGDAVADAMNGDGNPLRFLPSYQPALLSNRTDTAGYLALAEAFGTTSQSAPSLLSGNWIFPPPFGDDVLSWINKFAEDDLALFFFGWPDGDTGKPPVPIYGNYDILIENRRLVILPDSTTQQNPSRLLSRLAIETRPEKTFNRFLVWGNLGSGTSGLEGLVPAFRMAEARFYPSDPESAENSWELTDVTQNNIAAATGGIPGRGAAEAIAIARRDAVQGVELEWPTFTFYGDETLQLGDVVSPALSPANRSLGLHSETLDGARYRVERIEHNLSFSGGATFETTAYGRPLSAKEQGLDSPPPRNDEVLAGASA